VASSDSERSAARPLIGITTYLEQARTGVWDVRASFLPEVYLDGVTEAGGIAVLLPPQPVDGGQARTVVSNLDGLVIAGGADVDPQRYGQDPHAATGAPREDRDAWEEALLRAAIEQDVPFLGICRGLQMVNVALGGTLHQHLPDVVGHTGYQPGAAVFGHEEVEVEHDSRLAAILGTERLRVPVYHHQAIDEVAPGLRVTARTDEGIVEAIEVDDARYGVGVQWHPEEDRADRRLFASLVDAARAHRADRAPASAIQEAS
jgi:putative glutamine amidotransferase